MYTVNGWDADSFLTPHSEFPNAFLSVTTTLFVWKFPFNVELKCEPECETLESLVVAVENYLEYE